MQREMSLKDLRVVAFETRHAKTLADLIRLQGGEPVSAPSMKEVPISNNADALIFAEKLFEGRVDVLILLTGVGTRSLLEVIETRYPREKFLEALRKTVIVPRGPKPIRVLNEWKVPYALTVPEPNTWRELLQTLDQNLDNVPLHSKKIYVQEYGVSNAELLRGLEARGARVTQVPVYRWALPDDLEPLKQAIRLIVENKVHVAMFTTAVQIEHALKVAEQMDLRRQFLEVLKGLVVASVGPDCSDALRQAGVKVDLEPESPKMGPLVLECAAKAALILETKRVRSSLPSHSTEPTSSGPEIAVAADPSESVFIRACRRERTPYTPVWLMRQAGRYMEDYRKIRDVTEFLDLCKNPSLCCEVTVHAQERLGVDAAIIFSDLLLILEPMGLQLSYLKGDGPHIANPVRTTTDVTALKAIDPERSLAYVMDAIRKTRARLASSIPLIGFAGAPFTIASYMIEGGSAKEDFSRTKEFMKADWDRWMVLMRKIVDATARYLKAQIDHGAQAIQIFDSWAGVLTPEEYRMYSMPYSRDLIRRVSGPAPVIHFGTKTGPFLDLFADAGGDVIGVDQLTRLAKAWTQIGYQRGIQGNMDPKFLIQGGLSMEMEVRSILDQAEGRPGHIFNLGHGVKPETPEAHAVELVKLVHQWSRRS